MQAGLGVTQALVKSEEITDAVGFMSFGMPSRHYSRFQPSLFFTLLALTYGRK